jgi:hypothetical protein
MIYEIRPPGLWTAVDLPPEPPEPDTDTPGTPPGSCILPCSFALLPHRIQLISKRECCHYGPVALPPDSSLTSKFPGLPTPVHTLPPPLGRQDGTVASPSRLMCRPHHQRQQHILLDFRAMEHDSPSGRGHEILGALTQSFPHCFIASGGGVSSFFGYHSSDCWHQSTTSLTVFISRAGICNMCLFGFSSVSQTDGGLLFLFYTRPLDWKRRAVQHVFLMPRRDTPYLCCPDSPVWIHLLSVSTCQWLIYPGQDFNGQPCQTLLRVFIIQANSGVRTAR